MDLQKEFFACLALKHTPRLGHKTWKTLLEYYPSAYEAVKNAGEWPLLDLEIRRVKELAKSCKAELWREKAEKEFKDTHQSGMDVVTWFDPRFPTALKCIDDPPCLLYVSGDMTLLKNPGVAVVGARKCTALGLESAGRISTQLSNIGVTVISGLALGIDCQAHLGGLRGIGGSIAVLGCGLDINYPVDNFDVRRAMEAQGLIVTEYGPGIQPRGEYFPFRNRIISALSLGVLVAEAAHRSGSLITARLAMEQGREVFALPGPIGQPTFTGCHRLIKQGAALVENAEDIVHILRYDFARELEGIPDPEPVEVDEEIDTGESNLKGVQKSKAVSKKKILPKATPEEMPRRPRKRPSAVEREDITLNDEERAVMVVLDQTDKMHIDALGRALEWESPKVSKVLLILEIRGAVQQLPGMWYLAKES